MASHLRDNSTIHPDSYPLRITRSPEDASFYVHHIPSNQTLYIQPTAHAAESLRVQLVDNNKNNYFLAETRDSSSSKTSAAAATVVPLQALVGVYALPDGHVWVWLADSQPVYKSDHPTAETNDHEGVKLPPLYDIQQATDLFFMHVQYNQTTRMMMMPSSSRRQAQISEQHRQVMLWRQAWKDHTWYWNNPHTTGAMPDLTRSLQSWWTQNSTIVSQNRTTTHAKQSTAGAGNCSTLPWYDPNSSSYPDDRFFWNQPGLFDDRLWQIDSQETHATLLNWAVPMTSAFVGVQTTVSTTGTKDSLSYDHLLISRRSRFRAGTRFTKRGADASGRVANYAETEQVLFTPSAGRVQSFVQTRGSIPLRWSSPTDIKTYRPRVRIGTDPVAQARAVQRHLAQELAHYSIPTLSSSMPRPLLVLVNLVDKHSDQGRLGQALDAVLNAVLDVYTESPDEALPAFRRQGVRHVWFDFHAELKGGRWGRLQSLLTKLQPILSEHGYFQLSFDDSLQLWHASKLQKGVIRTNCMDCLDRTNVVQGILARQVLVSQLSAVLPLGSKAMYRKNPLALPWTPGESAHRHLWADNADAISRLYAGTPALKGDFTRTGKRTKKGALNDGLNSVQRYYLNNFLDADRQEGIDLLTCHEQFNTFSEEEENFLNDEESIQNTLLEGMSVKDAARQLLLGATWPGTVTNRLLDDESDHVRIKVSKSRSAQQKSHKLGLSWLPGDLQSLVRQRTLAPVSRDDSQSSQQPSEYTLVAMDKRAQSETPWWIQASSSSEENHSPPSVNHRESLGRGGSVSSTGFVLAAVLASTQAPLTTASVILSIVGASVLIEFSSQ